MFASNRPLLDQRGEGVFVHASNAKAAANLKTRPSARELLAWFVDKAKEHITYEGFIGIR
jgi:hypothetical protein